MGAILTLLGLIGAIAGFISIIVPLKFLRIRSRGMGAAVFAGSCVLMISETQGIVIGLAGLIGAMVGFISIIIPLRFLRIRSRGMGAAVFAGSCVLLLVTAPLLKKATATLDQVAARMDQVTTTDIKKSLRKAVETKQTIVSPKPGKVEAEVVPKQRKEDKESWRIEEVERQAIYYAMPTIVDKAGRDAQAADPDFGQVYIETLDQRAVYYRKQFMAMYGITIEELSRIEGEGVEKNWPQE